MTNPRLGKWHKESEREVFRCLIFDVAEQRRRSPKDGKIHPFYILNGRDWVNIVPITKHGEVVMVDQMRLGTDAVSLEIPGGIMEEGEAPDVAAARELAEETGYGRGKITPIGWSYPNPAMQSNRCHVFVAEGVEQIGEQRLDETEDMAVRLVKLDEVPKLIAAGAIHHALIIAAFYFYERYSSTSISRAGLPAS